MVSEIFADSSGNGCSLPALPNTPAAAAIRMMRPMTTSGKPPICVCSAPAGPAGPSPCGPVLAVGTPVDNIDPVPSAVRHGEAEPQGHDHDGDRPKHMDG